MLTIKSNTEDELKRIADALENMAGGGNTNPKVILPILRLEITNDIENDSVFFDNNLPLEPAMNELGETYIRYLSGPSLIGPGASKNFTIFCPYDAASMEPLITLDFNYSVLWTKPEEMSGCTVEANGDALDVHLAGAAEPAYLHLRFSTPEPDDPLS